MTANERRAEIMRILVARRIVSETQLAQELNVTRRTIQTDIDVLVAENPIEVVMGRAGGVKLPDWYHPHCRQFSAKQVRVLMELLPLGNMEQREVLLGILKTFGGKQFPERD